MADSRETGEAHSNTKAAKDGRKAPYPKSWPSLNPEQSFAAQLRLLYNCGAATRSLLNGQSRIKLKVMRSTFALLPVNGDRPIP
jgi:hypothetical protein